MIRGTSDMISLIESINILIYILVSACYVYQLFFVIVSFFKKGRGHTAAVNHKYALVIAARNESAVIAQLIESIRMQKYPKDLVDIYVIADNCTDDTADVARAAGALVYERFNNTLVGKGYALDYMLKIILSSERGKSYEGCFVFDADNLLDSNYIAEMNNVFDQGYRIVTCYRNSKNFGTNWISAGNALWFLRESKFLNNSRMLMGTSSAISGTGFLVHMDIIRENNGWKHHTLTEDIEFSADNISSGEIIAYCGKAKIYDEQPVTFGQSWSQRMRWAKGFYQVFSRYGKRLMGGIGKMKSFSCFDMLMTISPAMFLTFLSMFLNIGVLVYSMYPVFNIVLFRSTLEALVGIIVNYYLIFFMYGLLTLITEWKDIKALASKKIVYAFTFPIFMFTYVPIAIAALFRNVEWRPILHSDTKSIKDLSL